MRSFIALKLADETRERLATIARRLQEWELPARWVHPHDYHITLLYLGDTDESELNYLPYSIEPLACAVDQPTLSLPGLGAFGGKAHPRTVYAAVRDPEGTCLHLHETFSQHLPPAGSNKRFHPHITLCRPSGSGAAHRSWPHLFGAFGESIWGPCNVTDVTLYRSDNRGQGKPKYTEVASWPLLRPAA